MKKISLLLILLNALTACTTDRTLLESAALSGDRLLLNAKKDEQNSAEIVLVRDRSFSGGDCYYAVYIDNKLAARLANAEKVIFNLKPGETLLKVTRDPQGQGLCSVGDDMTEQKIDLMPSEKKYFRLSTSWSGWPELQSIRVQKF